MTLSGVRRELTPFLGMRRVVLFDRKSRHQPNVFWPMHPEWLKANRYLVNRIGDHCTFLIAVALGTARMGAVRIPI